MAQKGNGAPIRQPKHGQMKQHILAVARQLFITQGIDAVSYGDIAKEVGATRANIHYHFGNKAELVNEVFATTFAEVRGVLADIWLTPNVSLMARLDLLLADAEARFTAYNDTAHGAGVPWSLSSRAYLGFSAMAPEVVEGIRGMSAFFEEGATHAVQLAIGTGELRPNTPVETIVLLLTPLWYFGSPITQFSGLQRLRDHYAAVKHMIVTAYGAPPSK